jgi:hypothetical protein
MKQITIYREPGRYAGWPANYGIWSWGDEIVVGFTLGYMKVGAGFHPRDGSKPFATMQARSLDGGETWDVAETPCRTPGDRGISADEHVQANLGVGQALEREDSPFLNPTGVDFTHPDFAMMCARSGLRAGAKSWFYTSTDRCHSWQGPFRLPTFDQTGIAARTDYLVDSSEQCTLFLTASKSNGDEGRVFCARTTDGGKTFKFLSYIGDEPEGFSIMPASVRLNRSSTDSRILVAVRCRGAKREWETAENWLDLYASDDNAATWTYMNRPVERTGTGGNPPTLTQLHDGRLCLTYGYRDAPHSMCAKISENHGESWDDEIILRNDGGDHDIGYPRSVQRPDGKMVTTYYFNEQPDGERYIGATIWEA